MAANQTEIQIKRILLENPETKEQVYNNVYLNSGEPVIIPINSTKDVAYLVVGDLSETTGKSDSIVGDGYIFVGAKNSSGLKNAFIKDGVVVNLEGEDVAARKIKFKSELKGDDSSNTKYFIPGVGNNTDDIFRVGGKFGDADDIRDNKGVYFDKYGVMHGAAWNDYAENLKVVDDVEPGDVVCDCGDGTLKKSSTYLQVCPNVVTDTFGHVIGPEGDGYIPVAVAGRVLVKLDGIVKPQVGDCVCASMNGKASIMTKNEVANYPDRILGIITEIPTYEEWNGVKVNGRVWIKVK